MRRLLFIFISIPLCLLSCRKADDNADRGDYIRIYESESSELPLDRTWVSVKGGNYTYFIRSSVPFSAKWESEEAGWASIDAPKKISDGLWSIVLKVQNVAGRSYAHTADKPVPGLYSKRYGVLMLSCPEQYLGKFLVVEQGLENRIACDFSWLYGSADPNASYNDLPMSRWTAAQQNQGFRSTLIPGEEDAWVYSKEGYVKLGNDKGAGADLITPRTSDFQFDTLLVVSFCAVAQSGDALPDYSGGTEPIVPMNLLGRHRAGDDGKDNNSLSVEVSGGGYIRDLVKTGGTSISFPLPYYDRSSDSFPGDMFKGGRYLVFIEGTDANPISVNTAIRFVAGGMKGSDDGVCNRVFMDDIFVYRANQLLDEDLFVLNGGSGLDKISGGKADE